MKLHCQNKRQQQNKEGVVPKQTTVGTIFLHQARYATSYVALVGVVGLRVKGVCSIELYYITEKQFTSK